MVIFQIQKTQFFEAPTYEKSCKASVFYATME